MEPCCMIGVSLKVSKTISKKSALQVISEA